MKNSPTFKKICFQLLGRAIGFFMIALSFVIFFLVLTYSFHEGSALVAEAVIKTSPAVP